MAAAGAKPHRVVVVGGGFGGLTAVRALAHADVEVTLIDRRNFHLFQPLAYQAATGALSPAEIAPPLRSVFKRQKNARVLLGEVVDFDLERREVIACCFPNGEMRTHLPYDTLIVGGGSQYSYFGHDDWRPNAPELKSLEGALDIRSRVLSAFEAAEVEADPEERKAWLTFVVAGAGPTGVEMAGQIAELARDTLRGDFRAIDTREATVLLVEMADRVLTAFPQSLSRKAARSLEELGVTLLLGHAVVDIDSGSVSVQAGGDEAQRIGAHTTIWAAGVMASGLARALASRAGADVDRAGRMTVEGDLTLSGHAEVFAIGDMVRVRGADGSITALPGLAPVAMQQGRYVAKVIRRRLEGKSSRSFRYRDKGNLATIGRSKAVAEIGPIRIGGSLAWLLWLGVHIFYLIGFENRVLVLLRWSVSFFTHGRGARLITEAVPGGGRRPPRE
ncbi:MAG: NAD(P)/FAD-dependent oxidoreductase [Solirubrobacteraceae bacterium]